jgi:hypothetical protein
VRTGAPAVVCGKWYAAWCRSDGECISACVCACCGGGDTAAAAGGDCPARSLTFSAASAVTCDSGYGDERTVTTEWCASAGGGEWCC